MVDMKNLKRTQYLLGFKKKTNRKEDFERSLLKGTVTVEGNVHVQYPDLITTVCVHHQNIMLDPINMCDLSMSIKSEI